MDEMRRVVRVTGALRASVSKLEGERAGGWACSLEECLQQPR